jgi:hypothetical protein
MVQESSSRFAHRRTHRSVFVAPTATVAAAVTAGTVTAITTATVTTSATSPTASIAACNSRRSDAASPVPVPVVQRQRRRHVRVQRVLPRSRHHVTTRGGRVRRRRRARGTAGRHQRLHQCRGLQRDELTEVERSAACSCQSRTRGSVSDRKHESGVRSRRTGRLPHKESIRW